MTTSYTFSKSIDMMGLDNGSVPNLIYPRVNRARSDFDITHVFVQSYVAPLPFGKDGRWFRSGAPKSLLGGWQLNGVFTAQGGPPLLFTYDATTLNAPGNVNRPNINGPIRITGEVGTGTHWFDVSNFSAPAAATFGNLGRNILKAALDVTESGIRIVVAAPLTKNDEAELYFQNMQLGRSVKRLAKVIWSLATEEGSCCAGLHFDKPLSYIELQSIARPPRLMT